MRSHNFSKGIRRLSALLLAAACCFLLSVASYTPVAALPAAARQVRVGVAVPGLGNGLHMATLQCESGFAVGVSVSDGRDMEVRGAAHTTALRVVPEGANRILLEDARSGEVLYTHESALPLAIKGAGGHPITLQERIYPGFLELQTEGNGSALRIVNVVDRETYVKCVMSTEIGSNASREVRRAFSVLIRTVPMTPKHTSHGCDVCDSSCCQVYRGIYKRDAENDAIVDSTAGEYITYEGIPIQCLYHGGNGGASCSSVAAWGGDVPYLQSVVLPEDGENTSEVWQQVFTEEELFKYLSSRAAFRGIKDGISSVEIQETDPYGSSYVTLLSVTDGRDNTVSVQTSEDVRRALRFQSANFTVSYTMDATVVNADGSTEAQAVTGYVDADGVYRAFSSFEDIPVTGAEEPVSANLIIFDGVGSGHGVGFSGVGAEQLVAQGYSYKYLITFYFEGTEIKKLP